MSAANGKHRSEASPLVRPRRAHALTLVLLSVAALASGCATVQPWDRDLMAEKKMRFAPNPAMQAVDDHVYFSKEGSTGGQEVGGGGCGCN